MLVSVNEEISKGAAKPVNNCAKIGWFVKVYALALFVFLFTCFFQAADRFSDFPISMTLVFLNGVLSIIGQVRALRFQAALSFVSFVFAYLFFAITPIVQFGFGNDPVFELEGIAIETSINVLIFTIIGLYYTRAPVGQAAQIDGGFMERHSPVRFFALFLVTFVISAVAIYLFKDSLFTSREGFGMALASVFPDMPTALLGITFLQTMPFLGAAIGFRAAWEQKRYLWISGFSLLMLLAAVLNNPMINPRYKLAGLAFFLIDYFFRGRRTQLLAMTIIVGVCLAPIFQMFRSETAKFYANVEKGSFYEETFLGYDYDAFQTLAYTIVRVEDKGVSYGENILSALLFFVPRVVWSEKAFPTSFYIYETMWKYREVGTNNLSAPLVAEGYYAGWWAGSVLICCIYWWGVRRLSRDVMMSWKKPRLFLIRGILLGLVFILLRGTLIIGVSAMMGSIAAAVLPFWALGRGKRHYPHIKSQ